jgi:hypothetical protein
MFLVKEIVRYSITSPPKAKHYETNSNAPHQGLSNNTKSMARGVV